MDEKTRIEHDKMVKDAEKFIHENNMHDALMCCEDRDKCSQKDSCNHGHPHKIEVSCITARCWQFDRKGKQACQRTMEVF